MIDALPFRKLKFAAENDLITQLSHLESEVKEIREAVVNGDPATHILEEFADAAQSAITALYIGQRLYDMHPADVVARNNEKNSVRGYEL